MYQFLPSILVGETTCVKRIIDNAIIPFDLDNIDYQDYLKWLEEGNTPQPSDKT